MKRILGIFLLFALIFILPVFAAEPGLNVEIPVESNVEDAIIIIGGDKNLPQETEIKGAGVFKLSFPDAQPGDVFKYTIRQSYVENNEYVLDDTEYTVSVYIFQEEGKTYATAVINEGDKTDKPFECLFNNEKITLKTTATDYTDTEDIKNGDRVIIDKVEYKNLVLGEEYTLVSTAMDKETGKQILKEDGTPYEFIKTFTPIKSNSFQNVEMIFKQKDINGKTIVVFEKLYQNYDLPKSKFITSHEDINDVDQTVKIPLEVQIKIIKKDADTSYPLKGAEFILYNQNDEIVKDKLGNDCIGLTDENGIVIFEIFTNTEWTYYTKETKAPAGYKLEDKKIELTSNEDKKLISNVSIDVFNSTINIPPVPPVKTGDESNLGLWLGIGGGSLLLMGVLIIVSMKNKKKNK